jgi:hypothetical protein
MLLIVANSIKVRAGVIRSCIKRQVFVQVTCLCVCPVPVQAYLVCCFCGRPCLTSFTCVFVCAPPPLQAASGEDAAKAAWSAAAIELPSLLPSFANGPADVDKVLTQHEAKYLVA